MGLAGCGGDKKLGTVSDSLSTNIEGVKNEESETRIISTVMGDVEVPANPKKVAVQYIMGDVISLGVDPIGVSEVYAGAAYEELTEDITNLGHPYDWAPEDVMALDPDLIISVDKDKYDTLSKIAPTVYIPYESISTEERVKLVGNALNKEKEAEKLLEDYNTNIEESKKKLKEAGLYDKTVSMVEGGLDNMVVMGQKHGGGNILHTVLSLKAPQSVQDNIINKDSFSERISFEVLPQYCGDYLIRGSYEGMDDFSKNEIWNSIPAIKNNKLIEMDFGLSYYTDIYSTKSQVDYIVNSLLEVTK